MGDDLGERLVRVGLLTRTALGEALDAAPTHGAEMARELVAQGLSEDALAGFFVSEGFGPVLEARDLALADPTLQARLTTGMALEFLVYPVRETSAGTVVAMATPTDRHILDETRRALGREVVPTVARPGDIERAIRTQRKDVADVAPATGRARADSEPPVLELTRRRSGSVTPGYQPRVHSDAPSGKLGPRVSLVPGGESADAETPLLLVRHKAVPRGATPETGVGPTTVSPAPTEGSRPAIAAPAKTFARPKVAGEGERTTTGEYAQGPKRSGPPPAPKTPPKPEASESIDAAVRRLTPSKPLPRPPPDAVTSMSAPEDPKAKPAALPAKADPKGAGLWAKGKSPEVDAKDAARAAISEVAGSTSREVATIPPPAEDKWSDLPAGAAPAAENKVSRVSLLGSKAAAGDIGPVLSGIRSARDRDAVVRLACDGAITVSRAAVFLALKKGVLKGWDGAGIGISRDSVRNLWIPAGSASMFKRVLDEGTTFVGPYGAGIADGLFKAAVGSRGGDVMVQPVLLEGKVVGLLCVDDLRPGPLARGRIESLANAVGEAFRRVISAGKE